FFSSRRRHTRSDRDWSSDVCSSDLPAVRWTNLYGPLPTGCDRKPSSPLASMYFLGSTMPSVDSARDRYDAMIKVGCLVTSTTLRSEEHTSELQSRSDLVCRLLLEKK